MRLIIGLGNPGKEYKGTRHNAGFLVADELLINSRTKELKNLGQIKILKSDKFMNESGSCVKSLVDKYRLDLSDLYIIHDDLDIPLGSYKIQFGVGPKDHNGVNSVETELGTKDFWRVRIGIENRNKAGEPSYAEASEGKEYVLQNFTEEERKILDKTIKEAIPAVLSLH